MKSPTQDDSNGLGLFIVKEIVYGCKGQIEIKGTEEKGTTFEITLPRQ